MSERGKAKYKFISAGSNTTVKTGAGSLYRILSNNPTGSTIRVEDGDIGQSPDFNSTGDTDTITHAGGALLDYGPGIGFNTQLTVAASSNAKLTVVFE